MYQYIKRSFDLIISLSAIILLCPIMVGIGIAIKLETRGSFLFRQKRIGINKETFYILKFRTMRSDTPKNKPTHELSNPEQYITRVGKLLRKTSLDELPQLFNILKGDMSLIGPRPALWNQFDLIRERDKYGANDVLPGLTGWAQINGRDTLDIKTKARLDGFYVRHRGILMDIACFVGTLIQVAKQDGIVEGKQKDDKGVFV